MLRQACLVRRPRRRADIHASITAMYGAGLIIDGLEACERFQARTSYLRRAAVAGLFNSGTNFMTQVFRKNCVMPRSACRSKECLGYPFQVPWGKHNPPDWRHGNHTVPSLAQFNRSEILPVVVIKDPLTWMQSLCRHSYTARFARTSRCPSPLDLRGGVTVTFRNDVWHAALTPGVVSYTSLLDFWGTWYSAYWSQPDRLLVRYEDLLFDTKRTVQRICDCVGGRLAQNFDVVSLPAKSGAGHGNNPTDREQALARYASEETRYRGLTEEDLRYYNAHAHAGLVSKFHYAASFERSDRAVVRQPS